MKEHCDFQTKDTFEHVFDAIDGAALVVLFEFLSQVKEGVEVGGQVDALPRRLGMNAESQMQLPVCAETERAATMIRVNFFGTQESVELKAQPTRNY